MTELTLGSWSTDISILRDLADDHIVLIGEHALCLWSQHYGLVNKPDIGTAALQFYANHADIEAAVLRLQHYPHTTTISKIDLDASLPENIGSIVVDSTGGAITIHFIAYVDGVTLSDTRLQALTYALEGTEKTMLRVMHPIMCLEHWITRLAVSYKDKNPHLRQCASVAIEVAWCYIERCVHQKDITTAMKATKKVLFLAKSEAGQRVWHLHGVDVSAAVPELTLLANNCQ